MKINTDHLPFKVSSETVTNLPLWKAWVLNGITGVLINDIEFFLLKISELMHNRTHSEAEWYICITNNIDVNDRIFRSI
jgi:hypothetical protein